MGRPSVSIFLPTLLVGGAEKALTELANGLARRNWRVELVTMSGEGPLVDWLGSGVELVDLKCATYRKVVPALARYFERARPHVVLTSLYATGVAAVAARAFSNYKPRIVIGAHNSLRAKIGNPDNVKDKYFLLPLCRLFFPRADAFVPVSQGLADELQEVLKLAKEKIRVIYNPVVSPLLLESSNDPVEHAWLGEGRDFKTIISVGRLVEQKGFDVLLKAFAHLQHAHECRLIIVGDGPLRGDLQKLAQELEVQGLVDFVGLQDNPYKFVSRSDLFVLSSRWEGLGNVLIEALACGCPVVATDCNYGPKEILQGGKFGQLAPVDDPNALAASIAEALKFEVFTHIDKATLKARGLDFTVERSTKNYMNLFEEMIAGRVTHGNRMEGDSQPG